jgi:acetyl esterase/lipase
MLEIRPRCERCGVDLAPDAPNAMICSFECTYCRMCADGELAGECPNCGGELRSRPRRAAAVAAEHPPAHERMHVERGIVYAQRDGFRPLELDLYVPGRQHGDDLPLVLYVHGGGWRVSARTMAPREVRSWKRSVFERFTDVGFVVAACEYRYSGEATHPAPLDDVKDALRWLHANAAAHKTDPTRLLVWGASAGGHLAANLALATDVPPVRAAVCWYPLTDLTLADPTSSDSFEALLMGRPIGECLADAFAASPVARVRPDAPPFLLQHGTHDQMAPFEHSVRLNAALRDAGVFVELESVPGADHFFEGSGDVEGIFERTIAFLTAHAG